MVNHSVQIEFVNDRSPFYRPIFYQVDQDEITVRPADFTPAFSDQLYMVYLGKKQKTSDETAAYAKRKVASSQIDEVSQMTEAFCTVSSLTSFDKLIQNHEKLVSEVIDRPMVKQMHFEDYWGQVKSLGAWGGDFVMVTSDRPAEETKAYFNNKGYNVFLNYDEVIGSQVPA